MFKKILVPLDLTEKHEAALGIAADLARQGGGEVTLLHVIEVIPGLSLEEERNFYNRLEAAARDHLQRHSPFFNDRQVPCRNKIVYGSRPHQIAGYAAETGADLIVLTAPRIDPASPLGWGSMSYKVGILAHCPVLLVK